MKQILIVEDDSFLNKMLAYNPVSYTHLPLFLFGGILVFCLSVPDNMGRIKSEAKE